METTNSKPSNVNTSISTKDSINPSSLHSSAMLKPTEAHLLSIPVYSPCTRNLLPTADLTRYLSTHTLRPTALLLIDPHSTPFRLSNRLPQRYST